MTLDARLAVYMTTQRAAAAVDYIDIYSGVSRAARVLDSGELISAQAMAAAQILSDVSPHYIDAHIRSIEMRRHFGDGSEAHIAAERDRRALISEISAGVDDTPQPDGTEGARRPMYTRRERPLIDDDGKF